MHRWVVLETSRVSRAMSPESERMRTLEGGPIEGVEIKVVVWLERVLGFYAFFGVIPRHINDDI